VWARVGQRPIALSHHKYQWLYLYAFVRPTTGAVEWWVATGVSVALFQAVLKAFAKAVGAGTDKTIVVVLDNAGWHVSKKLKIPDGIVLCFLPAYSPELQPAERLWPLTDEAVANKPFDNLDQLTDILDQRCAALTDQPSLLKGHTHFHWWPSE